MTNSECLLSNFESIYGIYDTYSFVWSLTLEHTHQKQMSSERYSLYIIRKWQRAYPSRNGKLFLQYYGRGC